MLPTNPAPAQTPAQPRGVVQTYGSRPKLEAMTAHLGTGDIILQTYHPVNGGTRTRYLEVTVAPVWTGGPFPYQLSFRDLETAVVETVQWGAVGDHAIVAGPKVDAYLANARLCHQPARDALPKWNPKPADTGAAPVPGSLPTVTCLTSQLQPGDVFKQTPRNNAGRQQALFKVERNHGPRTGRIWLSTLNYLTGDVRDNGWHEVDLTLVAGPKCEAYQRDKSLFIESRGQLPRWRGSVAETV